MTRRGDSGGRHAKRLKPTALASDVSAEFNGANFVFGAELRANKNNLTSPEFLFSGSTTPHTSTSSHVYGSDDYNVADGLVDASRSHSRSKPPIVTSVGDVDRINNQYEHLGDRSLSSPLSWQMENHPVTGEPFMAPSVGVTSLNPGEGVGRASPAYVAAQMLRHRAREEANSDYPLPGLEHMTVSGVRGLDGGHASMTGSGLTVVNKGTLNALMASTFFGGLVANPDGKGFGYNRDAVESPLRIVRPTARGSQAMRADGGQLQRLVDEHDSLHKQFKERFAGSFGDRGFAQAMSSTGSALSPTPSVKELTDSGTGYATMQTMLVRMAHMQAVMHQQDTDKRLGGVLGGRLKPRTEGLNFDNPQSSIPRPLHQGLKALADSGNAPRSEVFAAAARSQMVHEDIHNDRGNILLPQEGNDSVSVADQRDHPDLAGLPGLGRKGRRLGGPGHADKVTKLRGDTVLTRGVKKNEKTGSAARAAGHEIPTKTADIHNAYRRANPKETENMSPEEITFAALKQHSQDHQDRADSLEQTRAASRAGTPLINAAREHNAAFSSEFSRDGGLATSTESIGRDMYEYHKMSEKRVEAGFDPYVPLGENTVIADRSHPHRMLNSMEHGRHIVDHLHSFLESVGEHVDPERPTVTLQRVGDEKSAFARIYVNKDRISDQEVKRKITHMDAIVHASKHYKIIVRHNGKYQNLPSQGGAEFHSLADEDGKRVIAQGRNLTHAAVEKSMAAGANGSSDASVEGTAKPVPSVAASPSSTPSVDSSPEGSLSPAQFTKEEEPTTPTPAKEKKKASGKRPERAPMTVDQAFSSVTRKFNKYKRSKGFTPGSEHEAFAVVKHQQSPSGWGIHVGSQKSTTDIIDRMISKGHFDDVLKHHTILHPGMGKTLEPAPSKPQKRVG